MAEARAAPERAGPCSVPSAAELFLPTRQRSIPREYLQLIHNSPENSGNREATFRPVESLPTTVSAVLSIQGKYRYGRLQREELSRSDARKHTMNGFTVIQVLALV